MTNRLAWLFVSAAAAFGADAPQHYTRVVSPVVIAPVGVSEQRVAEIVVAPRVVAAGKTETAAPLGIDQAVERIAAAHALPADLVRSVIAVESNYNPRAVSSKGARGLMQLVPATARRFGVANAFDPRQNLEAGVTYLKYLLDLYGGDVPLALAAYNAGEASVARFSGVPPFPETENYLEQVWKQLQKSRSQAKNPTKGERK